MLFSHDVPASKPEKHKPSLLTPWDKLDSFPLNWIKRCKTKRIPGSPTKLILQKLFTCSLAIQVLRGHSSLGSRKTESSIAEFVQCCFYWHAECNSCDVRKASAHFSERSLECQARNPWEGGAWSCGNEVKVQWDLKTPRSQTCQGNGMSAEENCRLWGELGQ